MTTIKTDTRAEKNEQDTAMPNESSSIVTTRPTTQTVKPTTHPQNADIAKVVRVTEPGRCDYILWSDYNGCCKPGKYDNELEAVVMTSDPHPFAPLKNPQKKA